MVLGFTARDVLAAGQNGLCCAIYGWAMCKIVGKIRQLVGEIFGEDPKSTSAGSGLISAAVFVAANAAASDYVIPYIPVASVAEDKIVQMAGAAATLGVFFLRCWNIPLSAISLGLCFGSAVSLNGRIAVITAGAIGSSLACMLN
jgi:hypothetical protein